MWYRVSAMTAIALLIAAPLLVEQSVSLHPAFGDQQFAAAGPAPAETRRAAAGTPAFPHFTIVERANAAGASPD